ncbi:MAG TPA: hypothetical protein VIV58_03155 [Kofleriaceae bacterium]
MTPSQTQTTPRSLDKYEHVESPIRDASRLGPTEDLDREPDGFPHIAFGLLMFTSLVLAGLVMLLWSRSEIAALVLLAIGAPALIFRITRKADVNRDRRHPSR